MANLDDLIRLISDEIRQRREEGCDVSGVEARFNASSKEDVAELEVILKELESLPVRDDFPYIEPSTLDEIRVQRPDGPRRMGKLFREDYLLDKIYGAWLGRCAGCTLGKPVEGWHRSKIEEYLKLADAYPLEYYFPVLVPIPDGFPKHLENHGCMKGRVKRMERDDDIDYTIMGLYILESRGPHFTTADVAEAWLDRLPYHMVYTAERVAYRNLVMGLQPPESATYGNPYREWIGAQIRADCWGYVTPGYPELGAEFAFRDAVLSHVKNGIYGEMFVAAMLSAAFVTDDIEEIIRTGLSEIPAKSRLAEAIEDTIRWSRECRTWQEAWERVNEKYGHYHGVHTINNAAVVCLGLLYGGGDFAETVSISVMGGWDTDCNGATAGSIIGAVLGAGKLPSKWIDPLNDTVRSFVMGFDNSRISDLAARTLKMAKVVLEGS